MSAPYLVTGVATQDVFPRLEIRDLYDKKHQFTLFILAWKEIRDPNYRPIAAQYEQIAGIHGMPYSRWPGDPDEANQTVRGAWLGYCNHASIMFPTWHRPCLMLLEQAISESAHGIAGTFAKKHPGEAAEWLKAARELRFPYWDWTNEKTGKEGLPKLLTDPKISILMPGASEPKEVENILAFYKFNSQIDGFNDRLEYKNIYAARSKDPNKKPDTMAYFKQWDRTYRWPDSTPVDVTENIKALNDELTANDVPFPVGSWANLRSDVAALFGFPLEVPENLRANVWDEFSNTRFQSSRPDVDRNKPRHSPFIWNCPSIEQPHNNVHLVVGGIGHMCDNDTAAYDPIFYLHHCNVDRILAFWEYIYPDYVAGTEGYLDVDGITRNPFTQVDGTYIETGTQTVDGETPLMPFRKSDFTYWTSSDTHSLHYDKHDPVRNKYYTYEGIAGIELDSEVPPTLEERKKQRVAIQKHFGYDPVQAVKDAPNKIDQRIFADPAPYTPPHLAFHDNPRVRHVKNYRQFILTTSLSQTHIVGSYILKVYIDINNQKFHIGSVAALGRGKSTGCGNCQARRVAGTRVQGVITLPHAAIYGLLDFYSNHDINGISDEQVIVAIKGGLRAHIVLPSGQIHSEPKPSGGEFLNPLPTDAEPAIRLLSCDVYQEVDAKHHAQGPESFQSAIESPFEFQDWKDHELLDLGRWDSHVVE